MASGIVVNGVRLRRRLRTLPVLAAGEGPRARVVVVHVAGSAPGAAIVRAAAAHLRARDLDAVDLVPADLPAEELIDLLRLSDRRVLRANPIAQAHGAGQAVVLTPELAARAGIAGGDADPVEVRRAFAQARRYAPRRVDQAIAPGLRALPLTADQMLSVWREQYGRQLPIIGATRVVPAGLAAALARATPLGALAVAAAAAAQPALVVGGTAARPPRPARAAWRILDVPVRLARSAWLPWRPARPAHTDPTFIARARAAYVDDLALGVERFFAPRRHDCPICGSPRVHPRFRTPDMIQTKPGTFRVDRCADCRTSFQNPQLTPEGLDFYYRDFYDGAGTADTEMMFASNTRPYQLRSRAVRPYASPRRWLDVGGGHGHFCLVAAGDHPGTRFELLDQSDAVEEAVARGWVAAGHHGLFPKLAPELEEQFDVVSMFHYLEHTTDPLAEIDAAYRVLEPGGTYMIEVPAPDCRPARWLGWAWGPWMQPQHLHLLPMSALVRALDARGFEILETERRLPAQLFDCTWAAFQVLVRLTPGPDAPWTPPRSPAHRLARAAGMVAGLPLILAGLAVDRAVIGPLLRVDPMLSQAYWVIARKPGGAR
jgi:SAM-dependent methyltransferase